ncbi:hypothetical protein GMLC_05310 [Geomonas limicola]|uniref:Chemotaxis methyl-accepting receptor HlyB-like 4HB MCP domain-containing protein n=1 Tax=Geomonas limicola TaxID=2740186 RepID=A0A6V8N345_9BACT|nr:hypothetical protein GMLC_05310 [Geomonas limicola]
MNIWMNLRVKTKLQVMVFLAVCVMSLVVWLGLSKMGAMADDEKELSTAVKHVDMLNDLKNNLQGIRLNLVYMLILHDPAKFAAKAEDIVKRKQAIKEGIADFLKFDLEPQEKELIEKFRLGCEEYLVQGTKLEQMAKDSVGNPEGRAAALLFATDTVAPLSVKPSRPLTTWST